MDVDPAWLDTDLYATLGVAPDATPADLTKAYRRLARELHPDTNADPAAEDRFKAVSAAYEVLRDPGTRAAYDQARQRTRSGARPRPGGGYTIRVDNLDGVDGLADLRGFASRAGGRGRSLFDDLLGSGPRPGRASRAGPRRGADARAELTLPFAEAIAGTTRTLTLPGQRSVAVRLPAGVDDGQTIRVAGKGEPGRGGGPPGDLLVTVHVEPHPIFGRDGHDLTLTVPVSYAEAALGADVTVPTLGGDPVTVRIPPGTPTGRVLRIRGRGVPSAEGAGDLLVTVHVEVPTNLGEHQRALLRELSRYDDPHRRAHLETGP